MSELKDHSKRAHALLSASSAHRWLECPPSAAAAELYPRQESEFAQEGTLAHEVAEWVASGRAKKGPGLDKGVDDGVTVEMLECARGYSDYIQELIRTDDAVVLLEQRVDFSPWVPDGFGTADCIIIQGDTMDVIDYKYGKGVAVSAIDNPQEKCYGLGALNEFGFAYEIAHVRLHIYQPRINNISVHELTADELLEWGERIKPIARQAAKGEGEYKPGEHCTFCPHAGKCRALSQLCTEYVETHELRVAVPVLAPHEVAGVLEMEPLIALWLRRVKAQALNTLLDGQEIPGWKVVAGKMGDRAWTDELQVLEALTKAGYSKEDVTKTVLLSPAKMDKAITKKKVQELLADKISRAPGAPTVVPATDKRPVYDKLAEAQKDFEQ